MNRMHRISCACLFIFAACSAQADSAVSRFSLDTGQRWQTEGLGGLAVRGDAAEGSYRFDAWRATLRYALVTEPESRFGIGFTTRGRNLEAFFPRSRFEGLPPMLHGFGEYRLGKNWRVAGDLDVGNAVGSRGRAFDLGLRLAYDLSRDWSIAAGYQLHDSTVEFDDAPGIPRASVFSLGTRLRF